MSRPIIYGQVVAGPPGSGKTTYCTGMQEYLRLLGRNAWVINLDPANEVPAARTGSTSATSTTSNSKTNHLPYETIFDVCEDVVNLSSVMEQLNLGPNGGLVYCMEYLEAHVSDIVRMIQERIHNQTNVNYGDPESIYLILDLPGQVEVYTHGTTVRSLLHQLGKALDLRLVAVQLMDAHYCVEATKFLSAALLGTTTMLRLELPTVSVLSKIDLLANYGPLPMSLQFFTQCHDLHRLLPFLHGGGGGGAGGGNNGGHGGTTEGGEEDYDDYGYDDDEYYDNNQSNNNHNHQDASRQGLADDEEFHYADDPDYQKARQVMRESPFFKKHERMHKALAEVVEDFGLLSFLPLDISSAESVARVLAKIDKCNGYVFVVNQNNTIPNESKTEEGSTSPGGTNNASHHDLFQCAIQTDSMYETLADIQERLSASREQIKKKEQEGRDPKQTASSIGTFKSR